LTIADVAAQARVSTSTASRALSGTGYVASEVRARVWAAAERIGYVPDANARTLRSGSRRDVGVLISDLRDPYYAELASGIEVRLRAAGYHMVLVNDSADEAEELVAVRTFASMRVAGVIVTPVSAKVVAELVRHGIHVVQADRMVAGVSADSVVGANEMGARLATAHMIEHGHRRIAMLIDEAEWTTGAGRIAGFRAMHAEAGIPLDEKLIVFTASQAAPAGAAVGQLLDAHPDVTAVMAANNLLAQGTVEELQRRGVRVPDEISLVAYDEVPWMSLVRPAVTTVDQHAEEIGRCSADLLVNRLNKQLGGQAVSILIEPELLVRESVARVRSSRRRTTARR
jgi:DNA-binding LacI/PurR family transcriptional regulator